MLIVILIVAAARHALFACFVSVCDSASYFAVFCSEEYRRLVEVDLVLVV